MAEPPPFGGGTFIADKSAWARASHPSVADEWRRAVIGDRILSCPIVRLELLYSTRSGEEFDALDAELAALRDAPITRTVVDAALAAMRELAHARPLYHRVKLPDLLIAAAAQDLGVSVLHYDRHYDRIAEVVSIESRWLAPAGSLA